MVVLALHMPVSQISLLFLGTAIYRETQGVDSVTGSIKLRFNNSFSLMPASFLHGMKYNECVMILNLL